MSGNTPGIVYVCFFEVAQAPVKRVLWDQDLEDVRVTDFLDSLMH